LNLVGTTAMEIASPIAMKNNFGFGGDNAVLVLRRWDR
jgi:3-oxoacyl-(acyl-carrier-protein) synthase